MPRTRSRSSAIACLDCSWAPASSASTSWVSAPRGQALARRRPSSIAMTTRRCCAPSCRSRSMRRSVASEDSTAPWRVVSSARTRAASSARSFGASSRRASAPQAAATPCVAGSVRSASTTPPAARPAEPGPPMSDSTEPSGAAATEGRGWRSRGTAPPSRAMTIGRRGSRRGRAARGRRGPSTSPGRPRARAGAPGRAAGQRAVRVGDRRAQHERRALALAVGAPAPDEHRRARIGRPTITTEVRQADADEHDQRDIQASPSQQPENR